MQQTLKARVLLGIFANALGKVWIIVTQLVAVPVLTAKWGVSGYGVWLMVSTVPTYIALSSLGFGTAAAVDMTQKFAVGERDAALTAFQSVWALMTAVMTVILVISIGLWWVQNSIHHASNSILASRDVSNTAMVLVVYSIITMQMSIFGVGYQSTRRYAQGTFLYDLMAPLEAAITITIAFIGGAMTDVAIGMTVVKSLGALAYYFRLRSYEPWIRIGFARATLKEVKRLAHPALASLLMTLSSALSIQGLLVTLGLFVSPSAVAVFATSRLLTRVPFQLVVLASRATLPEMSAAYARQDRLVSALLTMSNFAFTAAVIVPATLLVIVGGPYILSIISNHRLHSGASLFVWLALTAAFQAAWNTVGQFLYAINKQQKVAYQYLLLTSITVASPILFSGRKSVTIDSSAVWCMCEILMFIQVYAIWWRQNDMRYEDLKNAARKLSSHLHIAWRDLRDPTKLRTYFN